MKETTFKPRLEVLESRIVPTVLGGYIEIIVGTGMAAYAGYQLSTNPLADKTIMIGIGLAGIGIATKGGLDVASPGINNNVIPKLFKDLDSQLDHSVPALAPFFDGTIQTANQIADSTLLLLSPLIGTPAQAAQANTNTNTPPPSPPPTPTVFDPDTDDDDDTGMAGY